MFSELFSSLGFQHKPLWRLRLFRKWKWRPRRLPQGFRPKKAQERSSERLGTAIFRKHTQQAEPPLLHPTSRSETCF